MEGEAEEEYRQEKRKDGWRKKEGWINIRKERVKDRWIDDGKGKRKNSKIRKGQQLNPNFHHF